MKPVRITVPSTTTSLGKEFAFWLAGSCIALRDEHLTVLLAGNTLSEDPATPDATPLSCTITTPVPASLLKGLAAAGLLHCAAVYAHPGETGDVCALTVDDTGRHPQRLHQDKPGDDHNAYQQWADTDHKPPPQPDLNAPDVTGMLPAIQHTQVLAEWQTADNAYAGTFTTTYQGSRAQRQLAGRRRILNRHAPRTTSAADRHAHCPACPRDWRGPRPWPCPDYTDAADGLVDGLGPRDA